MRLNSLKTIIMLSPICLAIPAKADYTPSFASGVFPKGVTVSNETGVTAAPEFYRHGWTDEGWTIDLFGSNGYVAMSPTHIGKSDAAPARNVLALPAQQIGERMWLRFNAASMMAQFPESLSVEILPEGAEAPETLFSAKDIPAAWQTYLVPLDKYAGRSCAISFVCTSADKYILMLDAISITLPAAPQWKAENRTPQYAGSEGCRISGTLRNTGAPAKVKSILHLDGKGEVINRRDIHADVPTGAEIEFDFYGAPEMDVRTDYTVALEYEDGTTDRNTGFSDSYYTSSFARRHLVDKGTGMWCVNCPTGNVQLERLTDTFGDAIIPVETHVNDMLANEDYFDKLGYRNVPAFRMDRNVSMNFKFEDMKQFYDVPTRFDIAFDYVMYPEQSDIARLGVTVRSAEDFDNSSDRYRVGYVLTASFSGNEYFYQQNSTSLPSGEQYYCLPSRIPSQLLEFHHVSLTSDHAFDGMASSLPAAIGAGSATEFRWEVDRPKLLTDFAPGTAVAFVLDTETGLVMNACSTPLDKNFDYSSVKNIEDSEKSVTLNALSANSFEIVLPAEGDYTLTVSDLSGRTCRTIDGHAASGRATAQLSEEPGIYLLRLVSPFGTTALKAIVK